MTQTHCPACGWENEAGARICGGCGRPLSSTPGTRGYSPQAYGARESSDAYGAPDVADPDTPTVQDLPPYPAGYASSYPRGYIPDTARSGPRSRTPAPRWNAAPQQRHDQRRASPVGRIALGAVIAVALLALIGAGAWAAVIRPQVHQQVDSALRSQLSSMVATLNRMPIVPTTNLSVTSDDATATLQSGISSGVPVQNVQASFQDGRTTVSYTVLGISGTVSSALVASNGRLEAQDATVGGPMALVENSSELQAALTDTLANLRHDITVRQVTEQNGVLTVSVKGNA